MIDRVVRRRPQAGTSENAPSRTDRRPIENPHRVDVRAAHRGGFSGTCSAPQANTPAGPGRPRRRCRCHRRGNRCADASVRSADDACIREAASARAALPPRSPWTTGSRLTCRGPCARSPRGASVPPSRAAGAGRSGRDSDFLAHFWRIYGTEGHRFESCRARFQDPSAVGNFWPPANPQRWQHRWQQGNSDGVATRADRGAGRLPAWVEVRRGLPRERPSAQADGRHAGRRQGDQVAARRRGPRAAPRSDAARLHPLLA